MRRVDGERQQQRREDESSRAVTRECTGNPLEFRSPLKPLAMTLERRHVGKRLSELVIHRASGLCWLAGVVAEDAKADLAGQARSVLAQIDRLLGEAGSDKTKIISATIYLPDIGDFAAMNAVWEAWVPAGPDARTRDRRGEARERRSTRSRSRSSPRCSVRRDSPRNAR